MQALYLYRRGQRLCGGLASYLFNRAEQRVELWAHPVLDRQLALFRRRAAVLPQRLEHRPPPAAAREVISRQLSPFLPV